MFDLMEALMGDSEFDLVRQLAIYMDEYLTWAKAFVEGYQTKEPLCPQAKNR